MQEDSAGRRPSDKDAIVSAPLGDGMEVLATVNQYPGTGHRDWNGALVEDTSAFRLDVEQFYDMHTLLWDANVGQTLDVRNDAVASAVSYESPRVPEVHVRNQFEFDDGAAATLDQDILVAVDSASLFVRNRARFSTPSTRTLYTLFGLGIHDGTSADDVDEAFVVHDHGYDFVVAHDSGRYLAVAQRRPSTGQTTFDGCRIGRQGVTSGPDRSAWRDIYEENDGLVDDNHHLDGKVDAGFGLFVDDVTDVTWWTAVGFGESELEARENALTTLWSGYRAERSTFAAVWESWHGNRDGCPVEDAFAAETYELSLTAMKCAQDRRGGIIAGAFKPKEFAYRFVWPRDLVICIQALLAAGATTEALEALDWLSHAQITNDVTDARGIDRRGTWWQNYYADQTPHWRALQLDQVGGPIYAHWLCWRATGDDSVLAAYYDTSRRAADFLLGWDDGGFPGKHQDPWEEIWGYTTEGSAAAIAGLRSMAALADSVGEDDYAAECRETAAMWAERFDDHCFKRGALLGDHYVTADDPEPRDDPPADRRPDAAAFMAYWPWNAVPADSEAMQSTVACADDPAWRADRDPCVGRYPGDDYTPTNTAEDGGWPLCEAYADVVRWRSGVDEDAVADHVFEHSRAWRTAAGLLPERVDGGGQVRWNANLQWSQATYVLLVESLARGEPYGLAPGE
ncbi:glucan 1,4-alpha-glucosidase [Halogeometricum pallidum JCM 14848]|uniref:Glucan 1,4-alpha-glucosidase n=1 Tax=Halogeometricum pallidum JCM 14848 TaxID=1227487 RepID=M0D0X7_HALPD|nr:glycoside hydrolase family 15 protein [Halogeometricum pallidum]ELZ28493.1 glucan 1,4-alpha-glucosidase [Halogeometricum pallidum JCM 14848]